MKKLKKAVDILNPQAYNAIKVKEIEHKGVFVRLKKGLTNALFQFNQENLILYIIIKHKGVFIESIRKLRQTRFFV